MAVWQRKPGQIEDRTVSIDKYMDMAITDGFSSPRESVLTNNLDSGLDVLKFAGYQSEVLARAKGLIKMSNDPLMEKDYELALKKETERLTKDNKEDVIDAKLAVFKIAFILKEFELAKPKRKEMST